MIHEVKCLECFKVSLTTVKAQVDFGLRGSRLFCDYDQVGYTHLNLYPKHESEELVALTIRERLSELCSWLIICGVISPLMLTLISDVHAQCQRLPLSKRYLAERSLSVLERAPESPSPESPIIIGLHGLGHHKEGFAKLARALPTSWRVLFFDAPFRYHRGYAWYRFRCPEREEDLALSTQALIKAVKRLKDQYPKAPLAIFGFSQGGVMTLSALEREPQLWRGAVSLSGYWGYQRAPQIASAHAPPLLITHGLGDRVVPHARGQRAVKLMREAGVRVTPLYFSGGHQVTRAVIEALVTHFKSALTAPGDIE